MSISPVDLRDDGPVARALPRRRLPGALSAVTLTTGLLLPLAALAAPSWVVVLLVGGALPAMATAGVDRRDPLRWLVAPSLRAFEYGAVLALGWLDGAAVAAFAAVWATGYHHYDAVYRARARGQLPPSWLTLTLGGWDGRLLVVAVAFTFGLTGPVLLAVAGWCAVVGVTESILSWRPSGDHATVEEI